MVTYIEFDELTCALFLIPNTTQMKPAILTLIKDLFQIEKSLSDSNFWDKYPGAKARQEKAAESLRRAIKALENIESKGFVNQFHIDS